MNKEENSEKKKENIVDLAKKLRNTPNRRELLEKSIIRDGVNKVSPEFIGLVPTKDVKRKYYYELLKDKVLGNEPQLMDIIIDAIEELRGRFSCEITLISQKGGEIARLEAFDVLIENRREMTEYWIGKKVDKSSFEGEVTGFKGAM